MSSSPVLAVERMAGVGLGARRHRFALDRVEAPEAEEGSRRLTVDGKATGAPRPCPRPIAAWEPEGGRAVLSVLTPLRLFSRGRPVRELTFRALAFAMLRRVLELASCHAPEAPVDWQLQPLLERAAAVRIAKADLAWKDLARYSQRQGRKVGLGGLVGTLELEGELAPFAALLGAANVTHVGKGTTLGLGRLEVRSS